MQPAFNFVKAKPARFTFLHFGVQFTGAGLTANAHEAFFLQGMFGKVIFFLVLPDHFTVPVEHGMKAYTAMFGGLFYFHGCACGALVCTHAVDPDVMGQQDRIHGLGLVEVTAMVRVRCEQELAVRVALHELGNIGFQVEGMQTKLVSDLVPETYCLGKVIACVNKIDRDSVIDPAEDVQQYQAV